MALFRRGDIERMLPEIDEAAGEAVGRKCSFGVVRISANVVLADKQEGVVLRLTDRRALDGPPEPLLAAIASLARGGAPVLPPLQTTSIVLPRGLIGTLWPLAEHSWLSAGRHTDWDGIGTTVAELHGAPPPRGVRAWEPGRNITAWLDSAAVVPAPKGIAADLRRRTEALVAEILAMSSPGRRPAAAAVLVHTDAAAHNFVRHGGRLLLIDLDGLSVGPSEADLAPIRMNAARYPHEGPSWGGFLAGYTRALGEEPDSGLLRSLVKLTSYRPSPSS